MRDKWEGRVRSLVAGAWGVAAIVIAVHLSLMRLDGPASVLVSLWLAASVPIALLTGARLAADDAFGSD